MNKALGIELSRRSVAADDLGELYRPDISIHVPTLEHAIVLHYYGELTDEMFKTLRVEASPNQSHVKIFREDEMPIQVHDLEFPDPSGGSMSMLETPIPHMDITKNPASGLWTAEVDPENVHDKYIFDNFLRITAMFALDRQHKLDKQRVEVPVA